MPMYKEEQEALAEFERRCVIYKQKLTCPDASFSYQEKREALEFFGIKTLVRRRGHTPRFKIVSSVQSVLFPLFKE